MATPEDLTETEREALHELQRSIEHAHRAYGVLLEFHHEMGDGIDHLESARGLLREAGHDEYADALRDDLLTAGVFEDNWTYELVDGFRTGLLDDVDSFEADVREDLADGERYLAERDLQREWRGRAHGDE